MADTDADLHASLDAVVARFGIHRVTDALRTLERPRGQFGTPLQLASQHLDATDAPYLLAFEYRQDRDCANAALTALWNPKRNR